MVSQTDEVPNTRLATFLGLCDYLCVLVVADKIEKGACIAFRGITLDTIKMEARLPQGKLDKCLTLVKNYRSQSHISVSQLESLTGLLNFACRMVAPGRMVSNGGNLDFQLGHCKTAPRGSHSYTNTMV